MLQLWKQTECGISKFEFKLAYCLTWYHAMEGLILIKRVMRWNHIVWTGWPTGICGIYHRIHAEIASCDSTQISWAIWTLRQSMGVQTLDHGCRPYRVIRKLSVRKNCGNDNRGQSDGETPSGTRGPAGFTCVTNPLCDLHLRTDQIGWRAHHSWRVVFCRPSQLGGDWKRCELGRQDTRLMSSKEYRVGL